MYNNDKVNIGKKFENVVSKILSKYVYLVNDSDREININNFRADFKTESGVLIEVKYLTNNNINNVIVFLRNYLAHNNVVNNKIVFVFNISKENLCLNNILKSHYIYNFDNQFNIIFIENLLYLCDDDELKTSLIQCLDYSTENIIPQDLDDNIKELLLFSKKTKNQKDEKCQTFSTLLEEIPCNRKNFVKYENFCSKYILKIFKNNIEDLKTQRTNNQGLYRFDIVASIKKDPDSFWKFIYDKFNSCFILFDCKNYSNQITQNEIYMTERYLYNNALRNVGIILSRKGGDVNANKACQGILKEHGKLILILDDNDFKKISDIYDKFSKDPNEFSPSDYLFMKAKEFLLNLDK